MGKSDKRESTLLRLLGVKKRLTPAKEELATQPSERSVEPPTDHPPVRCLNCGYELAGLRVDRCPECGLVLASRYRDATPWAAGWPALSGWLETAASVWTARRTTRVRASLVPTTPQTARFARWSVLATAAPAAIAVGVVRAAGASTGAMGAAVFLTTAAIGAVMTGAVLGATLYGASIVLTGRWRRFDFVPSSLHYSTAWWPLIGLVAMVGAIGYGITKSVELAYAVVGLTAFGVAAWAVWLAASISESGRVRAAGLRVTVIALCLLAALGSLGPLAAWGVKATMTRLFAASDAGLRSVRAFGTFGAAAVSGQPRTCALLIDAIPGGDEGLILDRLDLFGAGPRNRVIIRGDDCTLATIRKAFDAARSDLTERDALIIYINGHGAEFGNGSVRVNDGEVTSQSLVDFLATLRAGNRLVIIDSCFGGNFVRALRDTDAVVLAATDRQNVAFTSGLQPFWNALGDPRYDGDQNGRVTIREAFWGAYRTMLQRAEEKRRELLAKYVLEEDITQVLIDSGYATPQLEACGEADEDAFAVDVKGKGPTPATTQPDDIRDRR